MEISGKCRILRMSVMVMVVIMVVEGVSCRTKLHKVGYKGWIPDYNYTDWSTRELVFVDDWLLFNFDKHYYNVLEVNKTNYESCNDRDFIRNITKGGRDVVQLTEARPYYFLSSGGYCWNGMKVTVFVQQIPPSPSPTPPTNASPTISTANNILLFYIALPFFVFMKFY